MFKNMKIGAKLGIGFGTLLIMLSIIAILGMIRMADIMDSMDDIVENRFPKTILANDIINIANDSRAQIRNLLLTESETESKAIVERLQENRLKNGKVFEKLKNGIKSEKGKALLESTIEARKIYGDATRKVMALGLANKNAEGYALLTGEVRSLQKVYFDNINELIKRQYQEIKDGNEESDAAYQEARTQMIILSIAAIILGLFGAFWITRSITSPLNELVDVANSLSRGDMSVNVTADTTDETGQLKGAMKNMLDTVKEM
uniref:MCP four helix bundle domain-containing protein n=1 Tax=Sulfurimonas sp. TaxID=2022749 RepID=UPI003562D53F